MHTKSTVGAVPARPRSARLRRSRKPFEWMAIAIAAAVAMVSSAHATTLDLVSSVQLVRQADLIFQGEVTNVACRTSDVWRRSTLTRSTATSSSRTIAETPASLCGDQSAGV